MVTIEQRSPPKIARFAFCGSTATVRLYQLWTWPTFTVVHPWPAVLVVESGESVLGFETIVGLAMPPRLKASPLAMRVQVAPASALRRYQAVAVTTVHAPAVPAFKYGLQPAGVVASCEVPACA